MSTVGFMYRSWIGLGCWLRTFKLHLHPYLASTIWHRERLFLPYHSRLSTLLKLLLKLPRTKLCLQRSTWSWALPTSGLSKKDAVTVACQTRLSSLAPSWRTRTMMFWQCRSRGLAWTVFQHLEASLGWFLRQLMDKEESNFGWMRRALFPKARLVHWRQHISTYRPHLLHFWLQIVIIRFYSAPLWLRMPHKGAGPSPKSMNGGPVSPNYWFPWSERKSCWWVILTPTLVQWKHLESAPLAGPPKIKLVAIFVLWLMTMPFAFPLPLRTFMLDQPLHSVRRQVAALVLTTLQFLMPGFQVSSLPLSTLSLTSCRVTMTIL